jgi:hypothetical protein
MDHAQPFDSFLCISFKEFPLGACLLQILEPDSQYFPISSPRLSKTHNFQVVQLGCQTFPQMDISPLFLLLKQRFKAIFTIGFDVGTLLLFVELREPESFFCARISVFSKNNWFCNERSFFEYLKFNKYSWWLHKITGLFWRILHDGQVAQKSRMKSGKKRKLRLKIEV